MTLAQRHSTNDDLPLYESLAAHVARLIEGGTFRLGEKVPSVRGLSGQMKVSVTTVLGAYRLLEDRGYIEARPQSGYFVKSRSAQAPIRQNAAPETPTRVTGPTKVSVADLMMMVLHDGMNPDLLQLGSAVPDPALLPARQIARIMGRLGRQLGARASGYEIGPGYKPLRVQVARRALAGSATVTPDEVIVTCGGQEAITLSLRALCKPGDTVALESPCYYGFLQAIESLGLKALEIPTDYRTGMSLEALEYALDEHPIKAVLVISNFNNPLGSCMPTERKKALVDLLARRDIPLIEDDIYGDFHFDPQRPQVCKAFDTKGLVLLCDSFSKTLSPGLRVGWVAAGRYQRQVEYLKTVSTLATATLPQMAVADYLAAGGYESHLRRLRRILQYRVRALQEAVQAFFPTGTKVSCPAGGHVLWVQMPGDVDALRLYEQAIQRGITIAPGPIFSPKQRYRDCIRLNAAHWSDRVRDAIKTLGRLAAGVD